MTQITPEETRPSEMTLFIIRQIARQYKSVKINNNYQFNYLN